MSQSGAPDPLYVASRRVLLDALEACEPQPGRQLELLKRARQYQKHPSISGEGRGQR